MAAGGGIGRGFSHSEATKGDQGASAESFEYVAHSVPCFEQCNQRFYSEPGIFHQVRMASEYGGVAVDLSHSRWAMRW